MATSNLRTAHDVLEKALRTFDEQWPHSTLEGVRTFRAAVGAARQVVKEGERQKATSESDTCYALLFLQMLLEETDLVLRRAGTEREDRRHASKATPRDLTAVLPAGTILVCPRCDMALYATTTRLLVRDVLANDGTLLSPVHPRIPPHCPGSVLGCCDCGAELYEQRHVWTRPGYESLAARG